MRLHGAAFYSRYSSRSHPAAQDEAEPGQHIRVDLLHIVPEPFVHHLKPGVGGLGQRVALHLPLFQNFPQADMDPAVFPYRHDRLVLLHILTSHNQLIRSAADRCAYEI